MVMTLYQSRGFVIGQINADNSFEPLRGMLDTHGIHLNIAARSEHVPTVERRIRAIKDRIRALRHSLPFTILPKFLIVVLVKFVVRWMNAFPTTTSISELSPRTIITGLHADYTIHCKLLFGSYVQTHEHNGTMHNSMEERTLGGIAMGPSDNKQGGYFSCA